jgi:Cu+-exporting ATPase
MGKKTVLQVDGMTCNSCAAAVAKYLVMQGVEDVHVNYASGEVVFTTIETTNLEQLATGLNGIGYKVLNDSKQLKSPSRLSQLELIFIICLLFTLPLLAHMFLSYSFLHNAFFQLCFSLPVLALGFYYFGRGAISSVILKSPNMDVLILTGAAAAYIYSVISILINGVATHDLFFETAASIITFVTLGKIIEQRSLRQTQSAINALKKLQPEFAHKISYYGKQNETTVDIPIHKIVPMDYVLINTGEAITVDGKIKWGSADIDESMLTGESTPVKKSIGEQVFAGTILLSGSIKVLCSKSADSTMLASIIELVKNAQSEKPSIQRIGDRVSAVFVPVVIGIAILTFFISYFLFDVVFSKALLHSISVLVVSCPCAMGLATPTAIAVGVGRAAKNGLLFRSGRVLELFGMTKHIVFDKTGTLTTGKFKVHQFNAANKEQTAQLIFSIEQHSSHPIAKSLCEFLKSNYDQSDCTQFKSIEEIKGKGMIAIADVTYKLGSASFTGIQNELHYNLFLTEDGKLIAKILIEDELQNGTLETVIFFKNQNIETVLLSGDTFKKCEEIKKKVGIDLFLSEQTPLTKFDKINDLKSKGVTAMIGDGINDAPSLALADVGVSFSNSSQVAINAAHLLILKQDSLTAIVTAFQISKQTLKIIKQNLFWAILYNVVTIPLAALGYIPPVLAVFSMAFSDLIVVGNSIRLKYITLQ